MLNFMPEGFPGISGKLGQMVIFGLSGIKSSITYQLKKCVLCLSAKIKFDQKSSLKSNLNCQSKKIRTATPTLASSKKAVASNCEKGQCI